MGQFQYRAYDPSGNRISGVIEAPDSETALAQLRSSGCTPVRLANQDTGRQPDGAPIRGLTLQELEFITGELALLLKNGLRIDRALNVVRNSSARPSTIALMEELSRGMRGGQELAQALAARESLFGRLYINLVAVGETTGNLPQVFEGLARDLRFRLALRNKVLEAITYPAFVVGVSVLAIAFIFAFIVPRLAVIFDEFETLPWYTQVLLTTAHWFDQHLLTLIASLLMLGVALWQAWQRPGLRAYLETVLLAIPGLRALTVLLARIRFSAGMGLMLGHGVKLEEAMRLAPGSVQNQALRASLERARDEVRRGDALSRALARTPLFPRVFTSLVEVGEESGELAPIFDEIASRSRDEYERWVSRFTSLLEPAMIVLMGLVVGSIVIVLLLSVVAVQDVAV
jgi:general secretion pathway protein F